MTIAVEQINAAYEQTGAKPIAGEYHTFDGTTHACCVLSVLYLEQFGSESLDRALLSFPDDSSYDPASALAHDLGISPDYARGVIDGFDGNSLYEGYPPGKIDNGAEYERGFELGKQARAVFIEEE